MSSKFIEYCIVLLLAAAIAHIGAPSQAQNTSREFIPSGAKKNPQRNYELNDEEAPGSNSKKSSERPRKGPIDDNNSGGAQHHGLINSDDPGRPRQRE